MKDYKVKKVLVPIDFSEPSKLALEYSSLFCKKFSAKLHLMHVVSAGSYDKVLPHVDLSARGERLTKTLREELNKLAAEYSDCNPEGVEIHLIEGRVAKEVVNLSKAINADLILMGTHGVSGFEEFFVGSNTYRVVTAATCPILSVQEKSTGLAFKNIAMSFDRTVYTRDKVPMAAEFAEKFGATIHMAGLITDDYEDQRPKFNLKIKQVEEYLESRNIPFTSEIIRGNNIAEMSMDFAKSKNADMMVIMTEQEASTGLFMGPYAQRIVNHSRIPVLSITPTQSIRGFSQRDLEGGYRPFQV